jgi:heme-degrading monooxygenase HmoA
MSIISPNGFARGEILLENMEDSNGVITHTIWDSNGVITHTIWDSNGVITPRDIRSLLTPYRYRS